MSSKSRGKESEIESVQSHQETSDLIEKRDQVFFPNKGRKEARNLFQDSRLRHRIEKESQGHLQGA